MLRIPSRFLPPVWMALRLGWDRGTLARSLLGDDALQVNCKPTLGAQLNHELRPEKTKQLLD